MELNLQKSTYREAEAVRKWNETITKQSVEAKTAAWKVQKATDSSSADNSQLVEVTLCIVPYQLLNQHGRTTAIVFSIEPQLKSKSGS